MKSSTQFEKRVQSLLLKEKEDKGLYRFEFYREWSGKKFSYEGSLNEIKYQLCNNWHTFEETEDGILSMSEGGGVWAIMDYEVERLPESRIVVKGYKHG